VLRPDSILSWILLSWFRTRMRGRLHVLLEMLLLLYVPLL
jgi:hypothetical protein